jgi:hypothetical protein
VGVLTRKMKGIDNDRPLAEWQHSKTCIVCKDYFITRVKARKTCSRTCAFTYRNMNIDIRNKLLKVWIKENDRVD